MKYCHLLILVLISMNIFSKYEIKNEKIFYNDNLVFKQEIYTYKLTEPDLETFEIINDYFARDKDTIYFKDLDFSIISDPKSFEILKYDVLKDKNYVYRYGKILEEVDSSSVKIFKNQNINFLYSYLFLEDKNGIYAVNNIYSYPCQIHQKEKKLDSFNILKYGYVEYNNEIYFGCNKIKNVDKNTFSVLELGFSKDKNNIYYYTKKLIGLDQNTFEIFENQKDENYVFYFKDENGIYALIEKSQIPFEYHIEKISNDFKNFKVLENGNSEDKKYKYLFDNNKKILYKKYLYE